MNRLKQVFKAPVLFIIGLLLVIIGIVLTLLWFPHVVHLFKGSSGMALAVLGLILMAIASSKW